MQYLALRWFTLTYFEEETSDEKKNNLKNTFDPYEQKLFKKLLTWINE